LRRLIERRNAIADIYPGASRRRSSGPGDRNITDDDPR
jgi:hypothetical protein